MMMMPDNNRLELRPLDEKEYHRFFRQYQADPLMDHYPYRYSFEYVNRYYRYNMTRLDTHVELGIIVNSMIVGIMQISHIDKKKQSCEMGIILRDQDCKNKGIGTCAVSQALDLIHLEYGILTVTAETKPENTGMISVLEKNQFHLCLDRVGERSDCLIYEYCFFETE